MDDQPHACWIAWHTAHLDLGISAFWLPFPGVVPEGHGLCCWTADTDCHVLSLPYAAACKSHICCYRHAPPLSTASPSCFMVASSLGLFVLVVLFKWLCAFTHQLFSRMNQVMV